MLRNRTRLVVSTGLAFVLALGVLGCSSSTTVETSTSVTDDEGNTTETTTTTTTDEEGTSTETTTETKSLLDQAEYTNEHFGFAYVLPDDVETADHEAMGEDVSIELFAEGEDSSVLIMGIMDIPGSRGFDSPQSWAQASKDAISEAIAEREEEDVEIEDASATVGESLDGWCIRSESTVDGEPIYRDYYFFMDADGNGLRVDLTADDELAMDDLRDGMVAFAVEK